MTTWAYAARILPRSLIACTAQQAADAVDAGYVVRLMTTDELLNHPFTRSNPMFTERQVRESRCYGMSEGWVWVHPANKAIWLDGKIIEASVPERERDSDRLTPDEAVRILRERGVIEDEPAFMIGDKVEVVGPIDKFWDGYVPSLEFCIGLFGMIKHVAGCTNLVDFGSVKWGLPASSLRHAKAEAAPAQPDKWAHLPKGGEWIAGTFDCMWHFPTASDCGTCYLFGVGHPTRSNIGTCKYPMDRSSREGLHFINRDQAIAIFEAHAAPDHTPDAGKMVSVKLAVAEARIAVLELQLADARSSEGVTGAQLATAEGTIDGLRKQLSKDEAGYDDLMRHFEEHERTIADLRKQAEGSVASITIDKYYALEPSQASPRFDLVRAIVTGLGRSNVTHGKPSDIVKLADDILAAMKSEVPK